MHAFDCGTQGHIQQGQYVRLCPGHMGMYSAQLSHLYMS